MKSSFTFFVFFYRLNFIEASFRCDYKYNDAAKGWFKHFVVPAVWYDARLRCTLEGAVLASPTTPEIEAEMKHIIHNFYSSKSEVFTGIHATVSQGDYVTVDGIPLSEFSVPWTQNEPDNVGNNESCITFNADGELADRPCLETRPYICYRSKVEEVNECGTTDPEYYFDKRTNSCYKFHTVPRNFKRANLACTAEGGHLAIINSEAEAKVIKELFAKYPGGRMVGYFWKDVAFIGFHDWGEHGDWRTIHGQTLVEAGYSKFSFGEPNNSTNGEFCGAVYRSGLLNDLWCENNYAFICEKNVSFPAVCHTLTESGEGVGLDQIIKDKSKSDVNNATTTYPVITSDKPDETIKDKTDAKKDKGKLNVDIVPITYPVITSDKPAETIKDNKDGKIDESKPDVYNTPTTYPFITSDEPDETKKDKSIHDVDIALTTYPDITSNKPAQTIKDKTNEKKDKSKSDVDNAPTIYPVNTSNNPDETIEEKSKKDKNNVDVVTPPATFYPVISFENYKKKNNTKQ